MPVTSARSRTRLGVLAGVLVAVTAVTAVPAIAQGPGLPRTYTVQRIESPSPAVAGSFGYPLVNVGDTNGDGEDDFGSVQLNLAGGPVPDGRLFITSGETGALLNQAPVPDPGGAGARSTVDEFIDTMSDIGSCPGGTAGQTCATNPIGGPDGRREILYGAQGVDVGGVTDVGRAYVLDGATLAVLKRLDMPPADRAQLAALVPPSLGGFGRVVVNPRGMPPCAGNAGVGPCPTLALIPAAVRIGDMDGGGQPDVVVGANLFAESSGNTGTAHPDSHCFKSPPGSRCRDSGRAYIYRGEDIAGSNPAVNLETPFKTLKNPVSQDDAGREFFTQIENFGHVMFPIGDVGACVAAIPAGFPCPRASNTSTPDGKADIVIGAHRADIPVDNPSTADFDVGVMYLVDGNTGSMLYRFEHPEPQPGSIFGFSLHQTFATGDLGGTAPPDTVIPAMRQNVAGKTGAGRGYVMNGDFRNASPNNYNITQLNDPTPTTGGNFSSPTEGVGDLVPGNGFERNELLIGGFAANAANSTDITDVHFANAFNETILQTIPDPDQQEGSKFGVAVAPLGDLNEDGFLDFAVGADTWDAPAVGGVSGNLNQGRAYIYRSDNSPPPASGGPSPGGGAAPRTSYPTPPATGAGSLRGCPAGKRLLTLTAAADTRNGTAGDDLILAGAGNDRIDALSGNDCVDLGLGVDRGQGGAGNDLLLGGGGNDRISGNNGNDSAQAGSGRDSIFGGFGNDRLHGQSGNDRVAGSRGRDRINGGRGNDRLAGDSSRDVINGDSGNDRISGGSSHDSLRGNSGNDRITGGSGRDRIRCGRGRDTVIADHLDRVARDCERVRRRG